MSFRFLMPMHVSAKHWSHKGFPLSAPVDRLFFHLWAQLARRGAVPGFAITRPRCPPNAQARRNRGGAAQEPYRPHDLCRALGISASRASEAITELVDRGLARRERRERRVVVLPVAVDLLLSEHMAELSSPVSKVFLQGRRRRSTILLTPGRRRSPRVRCSLHRAWNKKAVLRSAWRQLSDLEVADGELPDNETAMIQVWRYAPVFAGSSRVDDISLALSLAAIDDERIQLEVDRMFGKEYPWQEAL